MKGIFGIILLVLVVLACGCTGTSQEPPAAVQTTPEPAVTTAPAAPAPGTILTELSPAQPSAALVLQPGTVIVSFTADEPQTMTFSFTGGSEYAEMSEIKLTGPFSGMLAFGPPAAAEYQLNITGTGIWSARAAHRDTPLPLEIPVNLSGSGVTLTPDVSLEKGEYIFSRDETGLFSPGYELRFANGSYLMDADNSCVQPCFKPDSPDTFHIIKIPESGTYFLSAFPRSSPHPWNVSIAAVPVIPAMGPGPVMPQDAQL